MRPRQMLGRILGKAEVAGGCGVGQGRVALGGGHDDALRAPLLHVPEDGRDAPAVDVDVPAEEVLLRLSRPR